MPTTISRPGIATTASGIANAIASRIRLDNVICSFPFTFPGDGVEMALGAGLATALPGKASTLNFSGAAGGGAGRSRLERDCFVEVDTSRSPATGS
jgi:hypothetical protein